MAKKDHLQICACQHKHKSSFTSTYFVSSLMRLASTGVSTSGGTMLGGRDGGGDSIGLGWVRVNGSSTERSLNRQVQQRTSLLHPLQHQNRSTANHRIIVCILLHRYIFLLPPQIEVPPSCFHRYPSNSPNTQMYFTVHTQKSTCTPSHSQCQH